MRASAIAESGRLPFETTNGSTTGFRLKASSLAKRKDSVTEKAMNLTSDEVVPGRVATSSGSTPLAQSTPHSMEDFDVDALGHLLLNTPTGVTACMEQGSFLFNFDDMPSPRLDTTVTRPVHVHKYEARHKKEHPARKRRRRGGKGSNSRLQARVQSGDIHAPDGLDMSVVHGDDHAEISLPSPLTSASLVGGDLEFKSLHLRGLSSVGGSHDVQPESAHFARAHWPRQ